MEQTSQGIACGCKNPRSVWTTLFVIWFGFRKSCEKQGVGFEYPHESLPTWDILWFCDLKISCYRVEYPQHARWVSRARANEELKLVSVLKQTRYHATFLITLAHIPTPSQGLHNFPFQQISGICCSRCTWGAYCVLVYLLPKALWFLCQSVLNLLGILVL